MILKASLEELKGADSQISTNPKSILVAGR